MEQQMVDQEAQARRNREQMPQFSSWLATWRTRFGDVRVLHAREGGREAGVRFEDRLVDGRVPC